jgi:uncharacterized membrane protein (UPF0127 family)
MQIVVASSGTVVASDVTWAKSFRERTQGLIGSRGMEEGDAMVFEPASQIHTFGMGFRLDVVFCTRDWRVLHIVRSMRPARITRLVRHSRYVLELAGGTLPAEVKVGDSLKVIP